MRRLYYIADDLETTRQVSDGIHAEGITDHDFHVVSRDEAGLYRHHIHSATTYQQLDVVHTGQRWAMAGAVVGIAIVAACSIGQPWGFEPNMITGAAIVLLCTAFGAWRGGMIGMTRENYKLAPFHHDLEAGRHLILLDVPASQEDEVRDMMRGRFPQVRQCGEDSTLINPFESAPRVYHQNPH
ncbi:MAG TPA: hypothetical protein VLA56_00090 [Pseudomonadales bacterium]|nr:hypothetical protein [Pseudomonadales bacterium]